MELKQMKIEFNLGDKVKIINNGCSFQGNRCSCINNTGIVDEINCEYDQPRYRVRFRNDTYCSWGDTYCSFVEKNLAPLSELDQVKELNLEVLKEEGKEL